MILTIDQVTQVKIPLFESLVFLKFKNIALISCLWNIFLAGNFEPKKQLNDVAGWGREPKELLNLYQQDLFFPFSSCNFVFTFSTFLHFAMISDLINRCGCTLQVKWVFSVCSLGVFWVCSECSLGVFWVYSECFLGVLWMFSECSLGVLWVFPGCSWVFLSVFWVFSAYSLSVLWVCSECTLSVLIMCSELNWSCCSGLERVLWQWRGAEW